MKRIIIAAVMAAFALPAYAACDWWDDGYHCNQRRVVVKRKKHRVPEREVIRQYRSIEDDDDRICKPPVRGVGTQWIGEEGALEAAKKDWMERVRYDYGESFLDMKNARGPYGDDKPIHTCGRTSVGETLGQVFYRCQLIGRPCRGDVVEAGATTK